MFPFLASFIIFIAWLTYEIKKHEKMEDNALNDFWAREHKANNTRRKSLDGLNYIKIPFECIPKSLLPYDDGVQDCLSTLERLSDKKIVNLTGYTNTDLKIEYGTANLTVLSSYDENYTLYARTIYKLAKLYLDNGYESNARVLLEKGVESGTDIRDTYLLLKDMYAKNHEEDKLKALVEAASSLRSANRDAILRSLEGSDHKS